MQPWSEKYRPKKFEEIKGQDEAVAKIKNFLTTFPKKRALLLHGPPGTGKTTLANIISKESDAEFHKLSAVMSGKKDLRTIIDNAKIYKKETVLFIDEIHRWNKAQQDALLPHMENGTIILIGATTQNPSFSINSPLLSRTKVIVLESLEEEEAEGAAEEPSEEPAEPEEEEKAEEKSEDKIPEAPEGSAEAEPTAEESEEKPAEPATEATE